MATEIERKFLVVGEGWRNGQPGARYCQGYLTTKRITVRVRRAANHAYLTIKGPARGISRPEFEYPIPVEDAETMLRTLCKRPLVEKTRYAVFFAGKEWAVDVFSGKNAGLVLAEIELSNPDEPFEMPPWIGEEVTHDKRYKNSSLVLGEPAGGPGIWSLIHLPQTLRTWPFRLP